MQAKDFVYLVNKNLVNFITDDPEFDSAKLPIFNGDGSELTEVYYEKYLSGPIEKTDGTDMEIELLFGCYGSKPNNIWNLDTLMGICNKYPKAELTNVYCCDIVSAEDGNNWIDVQGH